jgi:hypothetical protein
VKDVVKHKTAYDRFFDWCSKMKKVLNSSLTDYEKYVEVIEININEIRLEDIQSLYEECKAFEDWLKEFYVDDSKFIDNIQSLEEKCKKLNVYDEYNHQC